MAAATTNWMMLDRFVFRRDNAEAFPGDDAAPWARGTTSHGDSFCIAFRIVEPPAISRLYLQWPGSRDPNKGNSCLLVAAHRNLLLFRLIAYPDESSFPDEPSFLDDRSFPDERSFLDEPSFLFSHHHFICRASPSMSPLLLRKIPMCTTPVVLCMRDGKEITTARSFDDLNPLGILCRGEEEFAMAQLNLSEPHHWAKMTAELCVLRSKVDNSDHKWEVEQHLPIKYQEHELFDLCSWKTDTVIAFNNHLCWVDYSVGGVLFCNVFQENPLITYLRLPIRDRRLHPLPFLDTNRSVCVTKSTIDGRGYEQLKFIDIARKDGKLNGPLSDDTGFSITYHSLRTTESNGMEWDMTFFITSDELWTRHPLLPREALMYPLVSMDKPNVVHFLFSERQGRRFGNLSVVTIDMSSKTVISADSYITEEDISGTHADLAQRRFYLLQSFFPSEIPKYLNLTS